MMTNTMRGLVGEFFCLGSIASMGWRVSHCAQDKIDAVCWHDEDPASFYRVQVKSSLLHKHKGDYHFHLGTGLKKNLPSRDDYDILALVAVDQRRCAYFPVLSIRQKTKRFTPAYFNTPDLEEESWHRAIDYLKRTRL